MQLKRSTRIQKPNPEYANITIVEEILIELGIYEKVSQSFVWVKAIQKQKNHHTRAKSDLGLVPKLKDVKLISRN